MWTTARMVTMGVATRLRMLGLRAVVYGLTVGSGIVPALMVVMGECATGGSTGCS